MVNGSGCQGYHTSVSVRLRRSVTDDYHSLSSLISTAAALLRPSCRADPVGPPLSNQRSAPRPRRFRAKIRSQSLAATRFECLRYRSLTPSPPTIPSEHPPPLQSSTGRPSATKQAPQLYPPTPQLWAAPSPPSTWSSPSTTASRCCSSRSRARTCSTSSPGPARAPSRASPRRSACRPSTSSTSSPSSSSSSSSRRSSPLA